MNAIYIITCILMAIGALVVAFFYVKHETTPEYQKEKRLAERQKNVKERRAEFGVSNRGVSMDDAPINIVPYGDLGINA